MIVNVYYVVLNTMVVGQKAPADFDDLHRELSAALLGAVGTFGGGGFGSCGPWWRSSYLPNVLLILTSFASFYVMLLSINRMLLRSEQAVAEQAKLRFAIIRTMIIAIWHALSPRSRSRSPSTAPPPP